MFQTFIKKERKSDANLRRATKGCGKEPPGRGEEIKGKEGMKSDDSLPRSGAQSIKA